MPRKTLCMLVLLASAACASGGPAPASAAAGAPSSTRRDPNVISRDELADPALSTLNVFEVIQHLRPNFLATRGTQTITNGLSNTASGLVHAAIDDGGVLELDELNRLRVNEVIDIRLLGPAAAMQRFGSTANQGSVIVVRTLQRPRLPPARSSR